MGNFSCLHWTFGFPFAPFENCLLLSFTSLSYCFSFSFLHRRSLYISRYSLCQLYMLKISGPSLWLGFYFLGDFFRWTDWKIFNVWIWLVHFKFCVRNPFFCQDHRYVLLYYLWKSYFCLWILRSLIFLELCLCMVSSRWEGSSYSIVIYLKNSSSS